MKDSLLGTKKVIPRASWRNSRTVSLVPLDDGTWIDDNILRVMVAFVALIAVEMLPGGIITPSTTLMNKLFHRVALTTVTFCLTSRSEFVS